MRQDKLNNSLHHLQIMEITTQGFATEVKFIYLRFWNWTVNWSSKQNICKRFQDDMKWLTFIRKDFFQLFQKNLALIWKYVTKTDIAKSRLRKTEILPSFCSECLASSLGRWTVSYECVMATGLMLACHHVTLHTGLWIPDLSYCPHGPHVTRIHNHPLTISEGWTDQHTNIIWEMIKRFCPD